MMCNGFGMLVGLIAWTAARKFIEPMVMVWISTHLNLLYLDVCWLSIPSDRFNLITQKEGKVRLFHSCCRSSRITSLVQLVCTLVHIVADPRMLMCLEQVGCRSGLDVRLGAAG
ncbi:unnamed protein product [Lathyrus oleraceus]